MKLTTNTLALITLLIGGQDAKPIQSYTEVDQDWDDLPPVESALPEDVQYDAGEDDGLMADLPPVESALSDDVQYDVGEEDGMVDDLPPVESALSEDVQYDVGEEDGMVVDLPPVESALPEDVQYEDSLMDDSRYENTTSEYLNYDDEDSIDLNDTSVDKVDNDSKKDTNSSTPISKTETTVEPVEKTEKKVQPNVRPMSSSIEILPYLVDGQGFSNSDQVGSQPVQFGLNTNIKISPPNVLPYNHGTSYSTYGHSMSGNYLGHAGLGNTVGNRQGLYQHGVHGGTENYRLGQGVYSGHGDINGHSYRQYNGQQILAGQGNTVGQWIGQGNNVGQWNGRGNSVGQWNGQFQDPGVHTGLTGRPYVHGGQARRGQRLQYGSQLIYGHTNIGRQLPNSVPLPSYGAGYTPSTPHTFYPHISQQRLPSHSNVVIGQAA